MIGATVNASFGPGDEGLPSLSSSCETLTTALSQGLCLGSTLLRSGDIYYINIFPLIFPEKIQSHASLSFIAYCINVSQGAMIILPALNEGCEVEFQGRTELKI